MVHFTVLLDGLTEDDVVVVEGCLTSARVALPGLATHPFNRQLRHARDRQLHGTFTFEFPCPDEPQRVALHTVVGAAYAWARDHRRDIFVRFLVDLDAAVAQCTRPKDDRGGAATTTGLRRTASPDALRTVASPNVIVKA